MSATDVVLDPMLTAEVEHDVAAAEFYMAVAQRGQAEGLVHAGVLVVAHTHHRFLQQSHDGS